MRRVLMRFERFRAGGDEVWRVTLSENHRELRTLTFADPYKIEQMAARGNASRILEDRQALENALRAGNGITDLNLTEEQFTKLVRR